jgi:hypothetical protein
MTPAARKGIVADKPEQAVKANPLDELVRRRAERLNGA